MKRLVLLSTISVVLTLVVAAAGQRKAIEDVDLNDLLNETQAQKGPEKELNFAWWIPLEFWKASAERDPTMGQAQTDEMLDALRPYCIVGVVRAKISTFGRFSFFDEQRVQATTTATFVDAEGKRRVLRPVRKPNTETQVMFGAIRPILEAAIGPTGRNLHLLVFDGLDKKKRPIVSPYREGKLLVKMGRLGVLPQRQVTFEMPLDSLFVPRTCPKCHKEAHVSWNYCPWCGTRLEKLELSLPEPAEDEGSNQ